MKIHLIKTRLANAFVVEYPARILVIDVAGKCHRHVLGHIEQTLGRDVNDIELVSCTHDDPDHMGGIAALASHCGAQMAVPHASGSLAHKIANDPLGSFMRFGTGAAEAFRPRMWKMYANPKRDRAALDNPHYEGEPLDEAPLSIDANALRLKDQELLPGFDDWRILHTPGHSWDSCCFYHEETGSLISGDTLLGSRKKERVVLPAIYANRLHFTDTLSKLRDLDIRAVYPGHGMVIHGENLLAHLK